MACASCMRKKQKEGAYVQLKMVDDPPFAASDIMVYDQGEVRKFVSNDWNKDRHKLILFFPETYTPVCETELGALNDWLEPFDKLGVDVFAATTDPIHSVKDWFESDELLQSAKFKVLSSYLLPARLGILNSGRAKRASVFVGTDGDTIIQEHFLKVGRSLKELHRTFFAFTTDSYCGEGWTDPSDGFLSDGNDQEG